MDTSFIYSKTAKGILQLKNRTLNLAPPLITALKKVDGRSSVGELGSGLDALEQRRLAHTMEILEQQGLIRVFVHNPHLAEGSEDVPETAFPSLTALQVEELNANEGTLAWAEARRGVQQLVQQGYYTPPDRAKSGAGAGAGRILIVEDDTAIAKLMQMYLTRQGFQVSTVADGEQALVVVEQNPPELVLLDVNLPNINGFDILTFIRAHETLANLPAIMVTAQVGDTEVLRGLRGGADGYIFKPFEWPVLLDAIRRVQGFALP